MRLDESALRREDFQPGADVTLADSQVWTLRNPVVRMGYDPGAQGFRARVINLRPDLAARFDAACAEYDRIPDTLGDVIRVELELSACLILANYNLADADLAELIQFSYRDESADPAGVAVRRNVMAVVFGGSSPPAA